MGAISFNNKLYPVGGTPSASMSVYDNSDSGLDATNVQDAIDELAEGGGGGGGHTIIDDTGTAVAQRSKLQFGDYDLTDDSENDITKVDLVKPEEVTWANYQQLTPAQKAGKQFYVPDYPSIGGVFFFQTEAAMQAAEATLPDNAVCIVWEDDPYVVTADVVEYDNTDSGLTADNLQDAVDEVVNELGKKDLLYSGEFSTTVATVQLTSDLTKYKFLNIQCWYGAALCQSKIIRIDDATDSRMVRTVYGWEIWNETTLEPGSTLYSNNVLFSRNGNILSATIKSSVSVWSLVCAIYGIL